MAKRYAAFSASSGSSRPAGNCFPKPLYAAVDIGSNKIRLDFYGVDAMGSLVKIDLGKLEGHPVATKFVCKLAEGMTAANVVVKGSNLQCAERALSAIAALINKYDIPLENVSAVGTEALRLMEGSGTKENKQAIDRLRQAFGPYDFRIISEKEESLLVGEIVRQAVQNPSSEEMAKWSRSNLVKIYAAIGGGSAEAGIFNKAANEISNPIAAHLGIHTLTKILNDNPGDEAAAKKAVFEELNKHPWLVQEKSVLYVAGGAWRALKQLVCDKKSSCLESPAQITEKLTAVTTMQEQDYQKYDKSVNDRKESMPLAAKILMWIAARTGAETICFLDKKVVDILAEQMHALATGQIRTPARGLEQLFSPSAPKQALRA